MSEKEFEALQAKGKKDRIVETDIMGKPKGVPAEITIPVTIKVKEPVEKERKVRSPITWREIFCLLTACGVIYFGAQLFK